MIRIGLTGTMGAGKSTVGDLFESWGAHRVDADVLARRVVAPGQPGLEAIRRTFGDRMLRDDGTLDRAALRAIVFDDTEALRTFERICCLNPTDNTGARFCWHATLPVKRPQSSPVWRHFSVMSCRSG